MPESERLDHMRNVCVSDIRISINPKDRAAIIRDLAIQDNGEDLIINGRIAERLRFFLISNDDGTECETFWWDGYLATHQMMAPHLEITIDNVDSGFVDIVKREWMLYDADSNGFLYPGYVTKWVRKLIG